MTARIVIAGVSSGVGKTTVVTGLARALRKRGLSVAMFKCGPDYLDPTYHARAAGVVSHNLDGFLMGREAVCSTFAHAARGADVALIEGVMGLFDGASPISQEGSTAEIAKWLDAPVLLVCDASGMARSVAALAHGFATFDRELRVAGVICNRLGSPAHLDLLRRALDAPPIVGGLPKQRELAFPERHLGLVSAGAGVDDRVLDAWAEHVAAWFDLDAVLALARSAPPLGGAATDTLPVANAKRCRIGLAFDDAFHFYYADNLRRLEALGAELVRFSPIADERLPDVDGLYIGGGYPELFAAELARNAGMRAQIAAFAGAGHPVYAECGGLMYLSRAIRTLDGARHAMAGVVPGETEMQERLQALGYAEVETQSETVLGPAGLRFRGHQFRYSQLLEIDAGVECAYTLRARRKGEVTREGYRIGNTLASYVHAHWASNPLVAQNLVAACAAQRGGA